MFSLKNNSVPSYFSRSILCTNQVHGYNMHSSNKFYIPFCRTNIRKFSVFYQGPVFFKKMNAFICDFFCNLITIYFNFLPYNNSINFYIHYQHYNFLKNNSQITHTHSHSTHDTQRQYQYY